MKQSDKDYQREKEGNILPIPTIIRMLRTLWEHTEVRQIKASI